MQGPLFLKAPKYSSVASLMTILLLNYSDKGVVFGHFVSFLDMPVRSDENKNFWGHYIL